jgi:hypothetical protein
VLDALEIVLCICTVTVRVTVKTNDVTLINHEGSDRVYKIFEAQCAVEKWSKVTRVTPLLIVQKLLCLTV